MDTGKENMKLTVINASHRNESNSLKICQKLICSEQIKGHFTEIELIDLNEINLPIFGCEAHSKGDATSLWESVSNKLEASDAFIFVIPEWAGMAPPGIKNLMLLATPEVFGHKPALLISISSGMGGGNTITEMRAYSYKNTHICYLPDHLIIRNVNDYLETASGESPLTDRVNYTIDLLNEYSKSLIRVRKSGVVNHVSYKFGMS